MLDPSYQIAGDDPILEVKIIKDKRGKGYKVQYLVEWAGVNPKTGAAHSESWEPAKYMKSAGQSIKTYEQQHGRKTVHVTQRTWPSESGSTHWAMRLS